MVSSGPPSNQSKLPVAMSHSPLAITNMPGVDFFRGLYPVDHWSMEPCRLDDPKMIALARFERLCYAIFVNPTDSRGYRCIVRLVDNDNMPTTFNREYTSTEHLGLALITEQADRAMRQIVPLVQTFKLGNNSHHFDPCSGAVLIGSAHEPCILHSHILGRGDPDTEYIPGIKLGGPVPGAIFDISGKGPANEGQSIVSWADEDIPKAASALKNAMTRCLSELPDKVEIEL